MNYKSEHDLEDEMNCVISCEAVTALCELIDKLNEDVRHLELECISTRYMLSQKIDKEQGELLRMDILENLANRYSGNPAYELYKNLLYAGGDPMEFREYIDNVEKACAGKWNCWH